MKKNLYHDPPGHSFVRHRRLSLCFAILLLAGCMAVHAVGLAQQKITLRVQNTPLASLLQQLSLQSGADFIYSQQLIESKGNVSLDVRDQELSAVLSQLLPGLGLECSFDDNVVVIREIRGLSRQQPVQIVIVGTVVDQQGSPLPGAAVVLKNDQRTGTSTDADGRFSLRVPDGASAVLIVSYLGKKQVEFIYTGQAAVRITLEDEAALVDDVIVTGIFERRAGSFTGSATTLRGDDLKRVGNANVIQSLKNIDPSLMIFDNMEYGSDPNKNPKILLHGESSIDLDQFNVDQASLDIRGTYGHDPNAPLFILDGFEATVEKIMDLDMGLVASLTILKDAAAKAIYGARASNGVIVIETMRSEGDKVRITYTGDLNLSFPDLGSYNLTNSVQKLELEVLAGLYSDPTAHPSTQLSLQRDYYRKYAAVVAGVDTDWLSKPLRNSVGHKHSLQFELGENDLRLLINASYNNVLGVMKGSDRVTYDGTVNISYRHRKFLFRDILTVTSNIANDSPWGSFGEYAIINPYYSPYDRNGLLVPNAAQSIDGTTGGEFVANPLYNAQLNTKLEKRYFDFTNNLYVEWNVLQGLTATLRFGITHKTTSADEFYPSNHLRFRSYSGDDYFRRGFYQMNTGYEKRLTGDLNVRFSRTLGEKHYIFGNVGFNMRESMFEEVAHKAEGFPNDRMNDILFARQYVKDTKPSGRESDIRDVGVLAAFNYSYDNRYMLDLSWQTSASSQFGANSRWGQFWSVGLGWNIHNEDFARAAEWLTSAKLRGSVGHTGAQNSGAYAAMATYKYYLDRTYAGYMGGYLTGMQNKELRWESTLDYNVGFDLGVARRLNLTLDVYRKVTTNTLVDLTLPPSMGFKVVRENAGEVINRGFDLRMSYTVLQNSEQRSFLTLIANISHNRNRLGELSDAMKAHNEQQMALSSERYSNQLGQMYYSGVSMQAIWGMRSLGIDPANGREIYMTRDGVPTYDFMAGEQVVLGDKLPKAQGNAGFSFEWRGFGGNMTFRYLWGGQMYNSTLLNKVENANLRDNVDLRLYEGVWKQADDLKPFKTIVEDWIMGEGARSPKTRPTSRFVQDRNELTLGNMSFYYDFYRHDWLRKSGIERLRFSFYMNDVFTLSSIEIERGTSYPFARTFNFSLTATF